MDSHRYLLDTNILSALIRDPRGRIVEQLNARLPATACTSIVVAAELQFGLCKGVSDRLRIQVEAVLSAIDILPLEEPVARHYGEIRAFLQREGTPIGYNDLFIAAHARALGLTLVTENVREFARVPELAIENWLAAVD
jgi:tRNA(fMet)-specific endonuclease VapC